MCAAQIWAGELFRNAGTNFCQGIKKWRIPIFSTFFHLIQRPELVQAKSWHCPHLTFPVPSMFFVWCTESIDSTKNSVLIREKKWRTSTLRWVITGWPAAHPCRSGVASQTSTDFHVFFPLYIFQSISLSPSPTVHVSQDNYLPSRAVLSSNLRLFYYSCARHLVFALNLRAENY